ncbi:uncharacterized protein LOC125669029 [Ostrea edulis]|uniref:uncharacterized protein LOC125669029 n=1 Tax=Ostrea edulis TaxID=37623 RepID=UPI0024AECB5B|nr:uncharacterized protein LOC125669029 [Ostrea edulis]
MLHVQPRESPAKLFLGRTLSSRLDLVKPNTERDVKSKQFDMASKRGSPLRAFEPGREVIVRDYRRNTKSDWVSGTISEQTGPVSYRVEVAPGQTWRRHIDQIQEFAANVSASDTPITNDISVNQQPGAIPRQDSQLDSRSQDIRLSSQDSQPPSLEVSTPPQIQQTDQRSEPRRNPRRTADPPSRYKDFVSCK